MADLAYRTTPGRGPDEQRPLTPASRDAVLEARVSLWDFDYALGRLPRLDGLRVVRAMRVADLAEAITGGFDYLPEAVWEQTQVAAKEVAEGLGHAVLIAVAIVGASTALGTQVGAAIGFLAAGVGAGPGALAGAELGKDAGVLILNFMGLGFLLNFVRGDMGACLKTAGRAARTAWAAQDNVRSRRFLIEQAARDFARAGALAVKFILEAMVAYLMARGGVKGAQELEDQVRASRLTSGFADWVWRNAEPLLKNPALNG